MIFRVRNNYAARLVGLALLLHARWIAGLRMSHISSVHGQQVRRLMEFLNDQLRTVDYKSAPWILACGVLSRDALQTP